MKEINTKNYPFCLFRIPKKGKRVIWEITNTCNYQCSYCIFSSRHEHLKNELKTEKILKILNQLKKKEFTHLKITGGEPFIRKDLLKILEHAANLGFFIDISTNASFITEEIAQELKKMKIPQIHVSLDGHTKEIQESIRGKNTFLPTLNGIKRLVKNGLNIRIGCVVFRENEKYLEKIIQFCEELKVNEVIFSKLQAVGRMRENYSLMTTKSTEVLTNELSKLAKKHLGKIKISYSFSTQNKNAKCGLCPGGRDFLYINSEGKVAPCTWIAEYLPDFISKKILGSHSLNDILKAPEMTAYLTLTKLLSNKKIASCPAKLFEEKFSEYSKIYSFATENIAGYYPQFFFKGKKVLAIGGSGDHLINAYLLGAKEVTCFDVNRLSKFYVELKLAALKKLSYLDFKKFFLRNQKEKFSFKIYKKLRKDIPPVTRKFFDKLYSHFKKDGNLLRESAFFNNMHDDSAKKIQYNIYLHSKNNYKKVQKIIRSKRLKWISGSIQDICMQKPLNQNKLDIILLSNIADYAHEIFKTDDYLEKFKEKIILSLAKNLTSNGVLIFAYIYSPGDKPSKKYHSDIDDKKSREKIFQFKNYQYGEFSFDSAIEGKDTVAYITPKKDGLLEGSKTYYQEANIYNRLSNAEDKPGKILKIIKPLVEGKNILDLGCGSGKYLELLAPYAKSIVGVEMSEDQLNLARNKTKKFKNIRLIKSSAEKIPLPDKSIDTVFASWVLGTIQSEEKREKILKEALRVLKKGGKLYLIENDEGGEFEEIRERTNDPSQKTKRYNNWPIDNGFKIFKKIKTFFEFKDKKKASEIIQSIWGKTAAAKIKTGKIIHKIVIFSKSN